MKPLTNEQVEDIIKWMTGYLSDSVKQSFMDKFCPTPPNILEMQEYIEKKSTSELSFSVERPFNLARKIKAEVITHNNNNVYTHACSTIKEALIFIYNKYKEINGE